MTEDSSRRFLDFDEARREARRAPIVVRFFERDWELPPAIPAAAVLRVVRWQQAGRSGEELSFDDLLELAHVFIPEAVLDAWLELGMDLDEFGQIIMRLVAMYVGQQEAEGEADRPPAGQSSSSSAGRSCAPTSAASTGSTSTRRSSA